MRPIDASRRLRIVVLGYIVRGPLSRFAWHQFQYERALVRLGHDAILAENSGDVPDCYNPLSGLIAQ
jgi:hypothetical protein